MAGSCFKRNFSYTLLQLKTKILKKRLALFYLVSTKNSTVATFVDYQTNQVLSTCHIGHVLNLKGLGRVHRRSIEAHKVYGSELRYVLDRYFFLEDERFARRERLNRQKIPKRDIISFCCLKFIVYFRGPSRYRRVVIKEFTKRFIREKVKESDPDEWNCHYVVFFTDLTSVPHNGCRARKVKRTRLKRRPRVFRKT